VGASAGKHAFFACQIAQKLKHQKHPGSKQAAFPFAQWPKNTKVQNGQHSPWPEAYKVHIVAQHTHTLSRIGYIRIGGVVWR
jgi:hypothetical protein